MIDRTKVLLAAALLLAPIAAHAQHGSPAVPHAAPAPAAAPGDEQFSNDAAEDEGVWLDGDLLAFGLGDEFSDELFMENVAFDSGDDGEKAAMDDTPDPDGQRRVVLRDVRRSPGGMGRAGFGAGMQGFMGHRAMRGGRMGMSMRLRLAQLDLSDAQRTRLRDLHEAHARRAIQRRADMQLARMDLHKMMSADHPNPTAVNAQIDKLARMHAEDLKSAFELRLQAKAVLTPEQVKRLHSPMAPTMMRRGMMDGGEDHPNH